MGHVPRLDHAGRPQKRIGILLEWGFHKAGDVETRLGYHVGELGTSLLTSNVTDVTPCLRSQLWVSPQPPLLLKRGSTRYLILRQLSLVVVEVVVDRREILPVPTFAHG